MLFWLFLGRQEALLMRQMKERRRAVYEGAAYQPLEREVCEHVSDNVRCTDLVLPLTKYCLKRILSLQHIWRRGTWHVPTGSFFSFFLWHKTVVILSSINCIDWGDSHRQPVSVYPEKENVVLAHVLLATLMSDIPLTLSFMSLTGNRADVMNDSRQVLYANCGFGEACRQPVASCSARCQLHMQLDPFEYRYTKREQDVSRSVCFYRSCGAWP